MSAPLYALCLSILGQGPASHESVQPAAPVPIASSRLNDSAVRMVADVIEEPTLPVLPPPSPSIEPGGVFSNAVPTMGEASPVVTEAFRESRRLFQSDHAFDGFTGPMSNLIQFKDPRSLTEARFDFLNNYSRPSTPVIGGGTIQVYALQLRLALTERLQIFADKDGIVRVSPKGGKSITGLANINAGAKYVWIRDVENQFLFSTAVQYEPPTGYASIFQRNGSGLLGVYGIIGKEFANHWHVLFQFGQNIPMQNQQSGYFLADVHIDRRFGRFTPFYEANWFYYNQPGKNLPLGIEGGGLINLGSRNINGMNYVTNAVGAKFDLTKNIELGLGYEFQVSDRVQLLNNMLHAQVIYRF